MHSIYLCHYFKDDITVSARVELAVMHYRENGKDFFLFCLKRVIKMHLSVMPLEKHHNK